MKFSFTGEERKTIKIQKIIKKNGLSRGDCTKGKPIFYKSKVFVRFVPKKRKECDFIGCAAEFAEFD